MPRGFQQQDSAAEQDHQDFGAAVDADGTLHVGGRQLPVVFSDVRFPDFFPELVVRTAEAAVEDGGQGGLRVARVGTQVLAAVFMDPGDAPQAA